MNQQWMIYGANGYTGRLIAEAAAARDIQPILAGRKRARIVPLADQLGLPYRCFSLDDPARIQRELADLALMLHCAGPFSRTAAPMIEACIATTTHYLDITGEIEVFENARRFDERAAAAGIVLCPGVGFDVVPTDCVAACLKHALPGACRLSLGFDSRSGFSPGTAKTSLEGLAAGGRVRRDGVISNVPLAYKTRRIDFGAGEKLAMTIPWGDVATAHYTTGIPDIDVYVPASPRMIAKLRQLDRIRPVLGFSPVLSLLQLWIGRRVRGPGEEARSTAPVWIWGEACDAQANYRVARLKTANGYTVTVDAALGITEIVLSQPPAGGYYTPSMIAGRDFVTGLPGSSLIEII